MPLIQLNEPAANAAQSMRFRASATREQIRHFVSSFYEEIQQDEQLGPVFNRIIANENWDHHFDVMTDFWAAVAFDGPAFHGNPMLKHARIRDLSPALFQRWLALFNRISQKHWPVEVANLLQTRAAQIAESLQWGAQRMRERAVITDEDLI